jgi:hypothetical protein
VDGRGKIVKEAKVASEPARGTLQGEYEKLHKAVLAFVLKTRSADG